VIHGALEDDPDEGCVWLVEGLDEGEVPHFEVKRCEISDRIWVVSPI